MPEVELPGVRLFYQQTGDGPDVGGIVGEARHQDVADPDRLADRRVGLPAVDLQLLDDPLGDVIEHYWCGGTAAWRVGHMIHVVTVWVVVN